MAKNIPSEDVVQIAEILENAYMEAVDCEDDSEFLRTGLGYKHKYWDMIRTLKDIPSMASLEGYQAVAVLIEVLHQRESTLHEVLCYDNETDAIDDLEDLWDKVMMAMNESPLEAAVRLADTHPLSFDTTRISGKYHRFLNIAYYLQQMRGEEWILLPVAEVAEILHVTEERVSHFRGYAKKGGFIEEVAKHCWNGNGGRGNATKFRFIGWNKVKAAQ